MKSKKKKNLKGIFTKFMSIFLIIILLAGIIFPAIIAIVDALTTN